MKRLETIAAPSSNALPDPVLTSIGLGWNAMQISQCEYPLSGVATTHASSDNRIVLIRNRLAVIDRLEKGEWSPTTYGWGSGFLETPGQTSRFRWSLDDGELSLITIFLPTELVMSVADAMPRTGVLQNGQLPELQHFDDRLLQQFSVGVLCAVRANAPPFYGYAAAQWIAAHLLAGPKSGWDWHRSASREHLSDRRLLRVLDYIEAHLGERLSLSEMAKEAGISEHHFLRLFRKQIGTTPHRHVKQLRLHVAAKLLQQTDKSVLDIALTCGFVTASHFAATFREAFDESPVAYRKARAIFTKPSESPILSPGRKHFASFV